MPAKRRKDNDKDSTQKHPNAMRGSGSEGMRGGAMRKTSGMGGSAMSQGGRPGVGDDGPPNAMATRSGQGQRMQTGRAGGGSGGNGGPGGPVPPRRRSCGTMDVHRRLLSESAEYRAARAAIENATLQRVALAPEARFAGVARIPVVVHVVWNTAAQNISDAQVTSQIDVLNRDFRATNPDVSTVPSVFSGLVADSRIEYFLATIDPSGNPTNGITRTSTSTVSFSDDDAVKSAATGGADPWPADHYLNIWVCQLGGGLLGYAQFPGGPAQTDGVVILHTGFGTTGTATAPFDLGRTVTHEIGHYFNLFHIWGDDGTGCAGSDQVDDTPNQAGPNFGVPTFPHVSCGNGPNGDLFMDYMDYVDDAAMVMFTHGQAARMEACIDTVRSSLPDLAARPTPSGPVVSWGASRIDAFVLGKDRALYHKWWGRFLLGSVGHRLRVHGRYLHERTRGRVLGVEPAGRVRARHRQRAVPQVVGRFLLGSVGHRLRVHGRGLHQSPRGGGLGRKPPGRVRARHRQRRVPQVVGRFLLGSVGHRLRVHGRRDQRLPPGHDGGRGAP